jgi:DNA-binding XRE family transcriptional regulator
MPQRPGLPRSPRDYVTPAGTWPEGPWETGAPSSVLVAAAIVRRLRAEIDRQGLSNTAAAALIGISRQALQDILGGRRVPDLHTLVLAEDAFELSLWPDRL